MRRSLVKLQKTATIIPVPMNLGQPNLGLDQAPNKLLDGGLPELLSDIGYRLRTLSPLIVPDSGKPVEPIGRKARNCSEVGRASEIVFNNIYENIQNDSFPLILGGDHCISIGTIPAIIKAKGDLGIIWVDAHGDINTPDNSSSGNMHGMPVAFITGLVKDVKSLPGFQWYEPCINPKNIVYIGLRDVDKPEKRTINKLGIKAYTMHDIDRLGIGKVMEETLAYFDKKKIHLSFDIDSIDPFFAPHTGTSVTGGLTYREGNYICEALDESKKLVSMEIVEVDPSLHKDMDPSRTISTALTLIGSAMGQRILREWNDETD